MRKFTLVACLSIPFAGCAADDWHEEDVGSLSVALSKGMGGVNGQGDYCNNPAEPCASGEGDCDSDAQCADGLVCVANNGPYFGMPAGWDVCAVPHCENAVLDADEEVTDCGGADCGSDCSTFCTTTSANGASNYCTDTCPCSAGFGDCDGDVQCAEGTVCGTNNGPSFGFGEGIDVCVVDHCTNLVQDADEEGIDCGGADCGGDCAAQCASQPVNGAENRCTATCPCPGGQGDCDGDDQCAATAFCQSNVGARFGFDPTIDMCLNDHCQNGVLDGNETATDCGGGCLPCTGSTFYTLGAGGPATDLLTGIAVDSAGNIIVAGRFSETTNLGDDDLTSAGSADIFLAKYSAAGDHIWSRRFGGALADGDREVEVAVGPANQIVLTGNFHSTVDFGGGAITSVGGSDGFVAMFEPSGAHRWSTRFGGALIDLGSDVAIDSAGDVVVTGSFEGTANFLGADRTSAGDLDAFIMRLSGATGGRVGLTSFGGPGRDRAFGVTTDAARDIYVTGAFADTVALPGGTRTSVGHHDIYVAKLSNLLAPVWLQTYGGVSNDVGMAVTVDSSQRVTVTGRMTRAIDFGGGLIPVTGGHDAFVLGLAGDTGAHRWSTAFGGGGNDVGNDVAVDSFTGRVAVVGQTTGDVANFPGGPASGLGGTDSFIAVYGPTGAPLDSRIDGGSAGDEGKAISIRDSVVGYGGQFSRTARIGVTELTSGGERDIFISRLSI